MHNENYGTLVANGSVSLNVRGLNHGSIDIHGTWSGTINFEGTLDGQNWIAIKDTLNGANASTTTSNGTFLFAIGGFQEIRARMSGFASGSAVISLGSSEA